MTLPIEFATEESSAVYETIELARAAERLRQERETFDRRKAQDGRNFTMRLAMGWMSVIMLPTLGAAAGWVVFQHEGFTDTTVSIAAATLFVDVVGIVGSVWKVVFSEGPGALAPVTDREVP